MWKSASHFWCQAEVGKLEVWRAVLNSGRFHSQRPQRIKPNTKKLAHFRIDMIFYITVPYLSVD